MFVFELKYYILISLSNIFCLWMMMLDFSIGTGLEYEGVVGLDRDSWRMPDRLGCARIAAMLVFRFC